MGKNKRLYFSIFLFALLVTSSCASKKVQGSLAVSPYDLPDADIGEKGADKALGEPLRQRAQAHYLQGNFLGTIQDIELYLALNPENEDDWIEHILYYCYMAVGRYEEAFKLAGVLVQKRPYEFLSYQQVGLAQLWMGQYPGAVENFQRALEFEGRQPQVFFFLGLSYSQLGDNKKKEEAFASAEKEYVEVLKANPADFNSNYELAKLYLFWEKSVSEVPRLLAAAKSALSTRQADEDILKEEKLYLEFHLPLLYGIYFYQGGRYAESIEQLTTAMAATPTGMRADLAEIEFYLASNFEKINQLQKAQTFFQRTVKDDPTGIYSAKAKGALRGLASQKSPRK